MAKGKKKDERVVGTVYVCNVCSQVTAQGRGMRSDGKIGPKAPSYCAHCGSPDIRSMSLYAALPEGMHLVQCTGEAHSNPYIDNCMICMPRWGRVLIPAQYESVQAYQEAERAKAEAAHGAAADAAVAKLRAERGGA